MVDGRLVENLHVLEARRLVALAEMIDGRKRLRPQAAIRKAPATSCAGIGRPR